MMGSWEGVVELDGKVRLQHIDFVTCRLLMQGTMQLLLVRMLTASHSITTPLCITDDEQPTP